MSKAKQDKTKEPATTPAAEATVAATPAPNQPQLAVQMYSLRSLQLPLDEILAAIAEIGYQGVELAGVYRLTAQRANNAIPTIPIDSTAKRVLPLIALLLTLPRVCFVS